MRPNKIEFWQLEKALKEINEKLTSLTLNNTQPQNEKIVWLGTLNDFVYLFSCLKSIGKIPENTKNQIIADSFIIKNKQPNPRVITDVNSKLKDVYSGYKASNEIIELLNNLQNLNERL
jgi:hypothetical protein